MVLAMDRKEFVIKVREGETFDGLVAAGRYDYLDCTEVTGERFPVRPSEPGERKIVLLRFGREINSEDAISEAQKLGLRRPVYEDALRFGAEHPDVQRGAEITFLHEPVDVLGLPAVLFLGCTRNERYLHNDAFACDRWQWDDYYYFAFVQP